MYTFKNESRKMKSQSVEQIQEEEEDEYSQDYSNKDLDENNNNHFQKPISPIKIDNNQKNVINKQRNDSKKEIEKSYSHEKVDLNQNASQVPSDLSAQIAELKMMIDSRNQQFEAEFDELKRRHQAKLKVLKQNHITREQTKSDAFDLEYRNLVWTTTLKHLNRGCFTDDLRLLFQQAISDEQYRLEKELLKLKQKNEEEIQNLKENLPKIQLKNKSKKTFINLDIMDPTEMAQIIYNNCFTDSRIDCCYDYEIQMIDKIISKIQKNTTFVSSIHLNSPSGPLKQKASNIIHEKPGKMTMRKKKPSPKQIRKMDKYRECVESHQEACQRLEKSVKETDKFIKNLQEKDWFNEIFPHVE